MKAFAYFRGLLAGAAIFASGVASAHEFTAAILAAGPDRETVLADAVRGFLLAADERDGHPNETSDGHLGGVDVQVLALPPGAASKVEGLTGTPKLPPGVVIALGPEADVTKAVATYSGDSIVFGSGTLPSDWSLATATDSFAVRYQTLYGASPTEAAAQGYNAARRLDLAIRPLDGLEPRAEIEAALARTERGIEW